MEDSTKSLTRYFFIWNIESYGSCVRYTEGLESPAFQLRSPWSSWNMVVKVKNTNEIQICLCRQFMGAGPLVINARFLLCLKTLHGTEMWKNERGWLPFTEGGRFHSEILFVPLSSETDETIVVTCDIFLTKADILRFNPSLKQLTNLEQIFNSNSSTENIVLNFGKQEKSINFPKDKLCSHCKEFKRIFRHCGREFEIRNYSPDVIKSLLKYVHFENPAYLANDRNLFELWPCALEFVASNVINILRPKFLYRTIRFSLQDRVYKWNYSTSGETLSTSHLIDTTEISLSNLGTLNICTDTTALMPTMRVEMMENSETPGVTDLYMHIWNFPVDGSFIMEISVCNNTDYIYLSGVTLVKPDSEGIFMCYTCIANEALFGTGNLSFPRHIKFNFKSGILQHLTDNSRPKQM